MADLIEASFEGRKTATTRSKIMGKPGDIFYLRGIAFEIFAVEKVRLEIVATERYKEEGFQSSNDFIKAWKLLHYVKGYDPQQMVFYHSYKRKE
jgi:hypothetical protein